MATEVLDRAFEREGTVLGLTVVCGGGFLLGVATAAATWAVYPPARGLQWVPATIVIGSGTLVCALYLALWRRATRRAGDWFVLGYTLAIVVVASLVISVGTARFLKWQVPPQFGVSFGAVDLDRPMRPAR